ncbi:MAG: cobalt ECF transporter T component CbiQ [Methanotrichaceae archaeon]
MSQLEIDEFSHLNSSIHRWDPRAKIASILALIFSIVLLKSFPIALLGLSVAVCMLLISRLPLSFVARGIKWPAIFLLTFLLILPFTTKGEEIVTSDMLSFSMNGLVLGMLMLTRGLAAVILIYPLVGSAPFNTTILALKRLGLPDVVTQIFLFAYRYFFLLYDQLQSMNKSLASKGFVKRTDTHTAKVMGTAIGMLFIRSYESSDRVYQAMISRGYNGRLPDTEQFEMKRNDWFKSLIVLGVALSLHGLEWLMVNGWTLQSM